MYFNQFVSSIKEVRGVHETTSYFGHQIEVTDNGTFFEGIKFDTLDEARSYIDKQFIARELYEDVLKNQVVRIISETHEIKVTNVILEKYLDLASSKVFSIDPAVQKIRDINRLDKVLGENYDYILEDNSRVIITKRLQERLNSLLEDQKDIVDHMKQSRENFFEAINLILEG